MTSLSAEYHDRRYVKNGSLSQPEYGSIAEYDVLVPMRDGTNIAVDIVRPDTDTPLPCLFATSPYGKDTQTMRVPQQPASSLTFDHCVEAGNIEYFVERGYNYVIMDLRGTGKSEGDWRGFYSIQDQEDCHDVIEWIAQQPWCDGNVGMAGHSYFGIMQLLTAAQKPKALKAIAPIEAHTDFYERSYPGGMVSTWILQVLRYCADHSSVLDSADLYSPEELRSKVDDLLKDPDLGTNSFFVRELSALKKNAPYMDLLLHPEKTDWWAQRSSNPKFDDIDVPVYAGGFWGYFFYVDGAFDVFMDERIDNTKMTRVLSYGTSDAKLPLKLYDEDILRWYDHWLKGKDTGITEEPPVKILVMGRDKFRFENEWPLARTKWTKFFLQRYEELADQIDADGDIAPDPLIQAPTTISNRRGQLTYTTKALSEDMEITGPPSFTFYASIDQPDGTFMAELFDVFPDGTERFLSKGYIKASHRELDTEKSTPWQPWHTHVNPTPVVPGEIYEFNIRLTTISNVFLAGHKVRLRLTNGDIPSSAEDEIGLDVSSQDKMTFMGTLPSSRLTYYKVYRDKDHPSHLLLPLIPTGSTSDEQWVQPLEAE